jgi:uncharacterized membrane protein (DUF4010 family)
MFPRVIVLVAIINYSLLQDICLLLAILTAGGVTASFLIGRGAATQPQMGVELENPFRLKVAVTFGLAFAAILFFSRAAEVYLGDQGVYLAASIAGIAQIDAIVLSMAELARDSLSLPVAATSILIAVLINTLAKAGIVLTLGTEALRNRTLAGFGIIVAMAAAMVALMVW